jgi:hypothetical protein
VIELPIANCLTANPFAKGQLAKVTETFSENLAKSNISALKFYNKMPGARKNPKYYLVF